MNSEELDLSLRSEFENYLKSFRAELRQEADELQRRLSEAFEAYAARLDSRQELDEAFTSTVTEHLRLSRDEGSKLAAEAMAEAERLEANDHAAADYGPLRDAVADISSQTSQSSILKSLMTHAADFAPRGAFFIIKREHFAGWKTFGEGESDDSTVREVHFSVSEDTILRRSIDSMSTVDSAFGAHKDDRHFLEPLNFGYPDRIYAVPLVARGRGVAVLYVDHGSSNGKVNLEALETIVRVAALTVELLAASHSAEAAGREQAPADFEGQQHQAAEVPAEAHYQVPEAPADEPYQAPEYRPEQPSDFSFGDGGAAVSSFESEPEYSEEPASEEALPEYVEGEPEVTTLAGFGSHADEAPPIDQEADTAGAMAFDPGVSSEPAPAYSEPSPFQAPEPEPEPAGVGMMGGVAMPERGIEVSPHSARPRLRDRPVDLPIDVAEEERRLHNDARRFARLLVSEIKLYNEKKVQEGRQANDLYERLREAIDRSREMYDKRVQPPVASKFDYFHYELVNALADGNPERLGTSYPGANI